MTETGRSFVHYLWKGEEPWGDYGRILIHGIDNSGPNLETPSEIFRTGPFVPPITQPGSRVIVTEELKQRLERAGLRGFSLRPAQVARAVRIRWEQWNPKANRPFAFPRIEEPEDYVLERRHSRRTARQMPRLWEIVAGNFGLFHIPEDFWSMPVQDYGQTSFEPGEGPIPDFFRPLNDRHVFASAAAKAWLEQSAPKWVSFFSVPIAQAARPMTA